VNSATCAGYIVAAYFVGAACANLAEAAWPCRYRATSAIFGSVLLAIAAAFALMSI